jgi:hypothetical protein
MVWIADCTVPIVSIVSWITVSMVAQKAYIALLRLL